MKLSVSRGQGWYFLLALNVMIFFAPALASAVTPAEKAFQQGSDLLSAGLNQEALPFFRQAGGCSREIGETLGRSSVRTFATSIVSGRRSAFSRSGATPASRTSAPGGSPLAGRS